MRKPRDFDAELNVLADKAKQLTERKLRQLGELVIACRADTLPAEQLAGALLHAAETKDGALKEGWRKRGSAFFQRSRIAGGGASEHRRGGAPADRKASSPASQDRA